jgi:hypothetical protein
MFLIKDVIYGCVNFEGIIEKIINTEEFTRLKHIKQTGICFIKFPKMIHTRYEHSLGVAWLTLQVLKMGFQNHISKRDMILITIGALIHDIGHCAFSHLFDTKVLENNTTNIDHHEVRGIKLFKYMVEKYKLNLTEGEVKFIEKVVLGSKENFKFQFVNNKIGKIDLDKIDYIMRDMWYRFDEIINFNKLIDGIVMRNGRLKFKKEITYQIWNLINCRYFMHHQVYQDNIILMIDEMLAESIRLSFDELKIHKYFENNSFEWTKLTDNFIISSIKSSGTDESKNLLKRIQNKDYYKINKNGKYYVEKFCGIFGIKETEFDTTDKYYCDIFDQLLPTNFLSTQRINYNH